MSEWISVKDRLPEVGVMVLCVNVYPYPNDTPFQCVTKRREISVHAGENSPKSNRYWIHGSRVEIYPTHWMPLPEPPQTDNP